MMERSGERRLKRFLPPLVVVLLALVVTGYKGLERVDRFIYDLLSSASTRKPATDILIIAVDEQSLDHYGQWPWPRSIHADLVDKLSIGGAKSVGFDVLFAEPGREIREDILLIEAVERSGRVVMPVYAEWSPSRRSLELAAPIPELAAKTAGLGHVDFELDSDGILRRTYLKAGIGKPEWPSFAQVMLQAAGHDFKGDLPGSRNRHIRDAAPGNWVRDYEVLLPFSGKPGHYEQISYAQFMAGDFDPSVVKDRFVLVGATAAALADALPTPVSGESVPMSGVEINANLLDALISGRVISHLGLPMRFGLTILLLVIPLSGYYLLSQKAVQAAIVGSLVGVLVLSWGLLAGLGIWFQPATVLVALALSYPVWAWSRLEGLVGKLFSERERAFVTLHSIGDGVITADNECRVEFMNPAAEQLTGLRNAEAVGMLLQDILPIAGTNGRETIHDIAGRCIQRSEIIRLPGEVEFQDRSGTGHIVTVSAGPLMDDAGRSHGVVLGIGDVTEKKEALQKLTHQATHDFLTNLPNRSLLSDRLQHAIIRAERDGNGVAVLFLDLDNFKKVNDQLGHSGGDSLLQLVSNRLKDACRSGDTVARLGGDEFVVLLESQHDVHVAATVAGKIIQLLKPPFYVDGNELFITGSVGISVFPKDGESGEVLMKNADIAMYEAKRSGRNKYLFFSDEMNEEIQKKLKMEAQLRTALSESNFELYYQPQVRLTDGRVVGVEALLRWFGEDGKPISPALFIPVAEETGLILPLSEWVLKTACSQVREWEQELGDQLSVSVNISANHFRSERLAEQLGKIISESNIKPSHLDLEITESLIMQDVERSVEIMRSFRDLGGTVSIDDFGTGYSSLSYLKKFPLDKLKIDKSFIDEIDSNIKNEGLAKSIITMGHGLGLTVVAEGVETSAQLDILRDLGCDIIQGYYYSRPKPADQLTALFRQSLYLNPSDTKQ